MASFSQLRSEQQLDDSKGREFDKSACSCSSVTAMGIEVIRMFKPIVLKYNQDYIPSNLSRVPALVPQHHAPPKSLNIYKRAGSLHCFMLYLFSTDNEARTSLKSWGVTWCNRGIVVDHICKPVVQSYGVRHAFHQNTCLVLFCRYDLTAAI